MISKVKTGMLIGFCTGVLSCLMVGFLPGFIFSPLSWVLLPGIFLLPYIYFSFVSNVPPFGLGIFELFLSLLFSVIIWVVVGGVIGYMVHLIGVFYRRVIRV